LKDEKEYWISGDELKKIDPLKLIKFYESIIKLVTKEKKKEKKNEQSKENENG